MPRFTLERPSWADFGVVPNEERLWREPQMTRITDDDKNQRLFNRCENSLLFSIKQIFLLYLWREGKLRGSMGLGVFLSLQHFIATFTSSRYALFEISCALFMHDVNSTRTFLTRKLSRCCSTLMGIWIFFFLFFTLFSNGLEDDYCRTNREWRRWRKREKTGKKRERGMGGKFLNDRRENPLECEYRCTDKVHSLYDVSLTVRYFRYRIVDDLGSIRVISLRSAANVWQLLLFILARNDVFVSLRIFPKLCHIDVQSFS